MQMTKIKNSIVRFGRDEEGATAIEYALIMVLIALAIITSVGTMGDLLSGTFTKAGNDLEAEMSSTTSGG